jgi:hypothetical protein
MATEDQAPAAATAQYITVSGHVIGLPIAHADFSDVGVARLSLMNGRNLAFDEPEIVTALQAFFGYTPPALAPPEAVTEPAPTDQAAPPEAVTEPATEPAPTDQSAG